MGEATYHLKVRWAEPVEPELLTILNEFRLHGEEAYDYWQDTRHADITITMNEINRRWPDIYHLLLQPGQRHIKDDNDLRARVEAVGGRLAIESGRGGARLEISLPVEKGPRS